MLHYWLLGLSLQLFFILLIHIHNFITNLTNLISKISTEAYELWNGGVAIRVDLKLG